MQASVWWVCFSLAAGASVRGSVQRHAPANVWVPLHHGNAVTYFNPATLAKSDHLPPGATASPKVSLLQEDVDGDEDDDSTPGMAADTASSVALSEKKSCYPKCTWNCTKPECAQDCQPDCEQPRCQTRCPSPDYSQCKVDCRTPSCSVFCPKDDCHSQDNGCTKPKCVTKCARAACKLDCGNLVPCRSVCEPPRCDWSCRNPSSCPKPQCRLICERPQGCSAVYDLPALAPSQTVQKDFKAQQSTWEVQPWGECEMACGKSVQTREVFCSVGSDHECSFSPKPATVRPCDDHRGCNHWQVGIWGNCSQTCGRGIRKRKVWCQNKDVKECIGKRPVLYERCTDRGPHCSQCEVQVYETPDLSGRVVSLTEGRYDTHSLSKRGLNCEDISSVRVKGYCCRAKLFQYGDFNARTPGWTATLEEGNYTDDRLGAAGAQDNDVSAIRVFLNETCSRGPLRPFSAETKDEERDEWDMDSSSEDSEWDEDDEPVAEKDAPSPAPKERSASTAWWFWILVVVLLVVVVGVAVVFVRSRNRL
mmetsp:Transcript_8141/g.17715  ORF Transcript_8141/g.17715 Transcript_8141/m.17715 type:complete len:534 (-) Transcript_8141:171-1772(-)